ncbi:ATP-binding protein [Pontibacillus yanchengensis]|uniref:ATP-binding protein n=1 Tax=Pontibacillus yanchengensis TaxID=462910 RepID=UPI000B0A4ECC|nr:sensor histidine kinase [Pontibacillus yanchengensis]
MSLNRMPIRWKITILSFGIVLFSIVIGGIILIGNTIDNKEEELGERAMITGRTVANLPGVKNNLTKSKGWKQINPIVERIRTINGSDYIVVLNMNRIRFSHPVEDKLGTISSGKDEGPAFAEHSYTSKGEGELGTAIRAFVPIMNEEQEQIGVVIVGNVIPTLQEVIMGMKNEILLILFLTSVFGVFGSWMLANHLKGQTYHLEPHEIGQLLKERNATFHAMNDGVISIDREGRIALLNEKAQNLLDISASQTGRPIQDVIEDSRLPAVLQNGQPIYNEEIRVKGKVVLSTRVPIFVNEEVIGALAIFQDRTDVTQLAEELTGVKAFVEALRIQNHEHLNKLHTISGLIQLDQKEKALEFVFDITERQEELTRFLVERMNDYSIAGLLLSKVMRGQELGIEVTIDEYSILEDYPPLLDKHDIVLLLGNLIENAFDAFDTTNHKDRFIHISIIQSDLTCTFQVEDNGEGIEDEKVANIFEKRYTTKGKKGSGVGLYLVNNVVHKGKGSIDVISSPGKGSSFVLTFPMYEEEGVSGGE